jgi:uncharacterized protein YjbI with pentapeptide repeats
MRYLSAQSKQVGPWWARRPVWIALLVLLGLVVLASCIYVLPQVLVPGRSADSLTRVDDPAKRLELEDARLKQRNDARTTLVQGLAGAVVAVGLSLTWRQIRVNHEGQITERFNKAIDHLGSETLDLRLGGIYALERIARNSDDDRDTIAEILTAFVRQRSPWPPTQPGQYRDDFSVKKQPELRTRAADIQAALTVLGRVGFTRQGALQLDLAEVDVRKAALAGAHLQGTNLGGAHLESANLRGARLQRATLDGACLEGADLTGAYFEGASFILAHLEHARLFRTDLEYADLLGANLEGADLGGAYLRGVNLGLSNLRGADLIDADLTLASLHGAHLQGADLTGAYLRRADLRGAHLEGADLGDANLEGARLDHANLQGVSLDGANLQGVSLDGANLQSVRLDGAYFLLDVRADVHTIWPDGFDASSFGIKVAEATHERDGGGG